MAFTIDLNHDMVDNIVYNALVETKKNFTKELGIYHDRGQNPNIFFWDEPENDIAEIEKHIDAINVLLSWYHIPE